MCQKIKIFTFFLSNFQSKWTYKQISNWSSNCLWCISLKYLAMILKWCIFINLKFMFNALYMLLLKYFIIIKMKEIVAPWIDFDDYKVFERITNDSGLEKNLLQLRGKIIILSRPDSEASRARTEDLQSIRGNFNIFGCVFWKKIMFINLSRPHELTHGKRGWTAYYF